MNKSVIDQVVDRADIMDVVSDVVQLKKSGANYKGCCPFHNEKTPSFMVNTSVTHGIALVLAMRVATLSASS